jgi:NAD+ kinase
LRTLYAFDFPETRIAGINFGHLGFFQEFDKENLSEFVGKYKSGDYVIQEYSPIDARVYAAGGIENLKCLNEIAVKGTHAFAASLDVHIAGSKIETFYGDGIVVATAAGSTAYNYALSGSIIDHRLNALQLTPIAPIKSAEFSSFTSGIILPPSETLSIIPRRIKSKEILLAGDGIERNSAGLEKIEISLAKKPIRLLRFSDYDFWDMVKRKLL